jgi:hypothetical protein
MLSLELPLHVACASLAHVLDFQCQPFRKVKLLVGPARIFVCQTEEPVISYDRIAHVRCKALFPHFSDTALTPSEFPCNLKGPTQL